MRMARNARHTIDFDFNDVGRRVRNIDEYNTTNNSNSSSGQAQDEDTGVALRCDSPVIARLGPVVNCSNSNSSSGAGDTLEVTLNNNNNSSSSGTGGGSSNSNLNRRRCGKTSVDLRPHHAQNQRFQLPEQIDECPSSGDEGVVSPRKRIKMDYHHHHHSNASAVSHSNI